MSREASPELDAEVHQAVFPKHIVYLGEKSGEWWYKTGTNPLKSQYNLVPRYSIDMRAAWKLADEIGLSIVRSEDGFYAIKAADIEHGNVRGTDFPRLCLIGNEGDDWQPAETAQLAICLAALALATPTPEAK